MSQEKTLLVIDDEKNIRSAIQRMLHENLPSVTVKTAGTYEDVLQEMRTSMPDLILLDVMMPGMNGLQVLNNFKNNESSAVRQIPVIMLSAVGNQEIVLKAKKMGAVDYEMKPFNEKIFLLKLRKYLKIKASERTIINNERGNEIKKDL